MALNKDASNCFAATATGTNAGATATITGIANQRFAVTHISGWSDAASLVQILGGANGTTVVWQLKIAANGSVNITSDPDSPLYIGVAGQNVSAKVVSSTAGCDVNIAGFAYSKV